MAIAVSLPFFYVLSSGPVLGLLDRLDYGDTITLIYSAYRPLCYFAESPSGPSTLLRRYINFWAVDDQKIPEPPEYMADALSRPK